MMSEDNGWKWDFGIAGLLFAVSWLLFDSQGIGLSWDSNYYLLFSQLMRLNFDFTTQGVYAPLYPMLLAGLTSLSASTESALVLVHSATVAIVFLCSSRLAREAGLFSPLAQLTGIYGALVALGSATFQFAWTEVPYTALLTACILIAVAFYRGTLASSVWWFIPIGFLTPLRFIGIIPAALLTGLMTWRAWTMGRAMPVKLSSLVAGLALAFGPITIFAVINSIAWGCPFGCRDPSSVTLSQNLSLTLSTLKSEGPQLAGGVLVLAAALLTMSLRRRVTHDAESWDIPDERSAWVTWAVPLAVVLLSVGEQIYVSTHSDIDPINPPYFAPIYPALVVAMVVAAWRIFVALPKSPALPVFVVTLVVATLVAGYRDFALYAGLADDAMDPEASLSDFGFKLSPMLQLWRNAQSELLAEDHAGSIATYYPLTDDSANLAAYLVLDSAYGPKDAKCRPGAVRTLADGDTRIRLDCMTAHGVKQLQVAVISNLARIPADTELLIMDKTSFSDSAADPPDLNSENFQIIGDNPSHRILRRRL
jgi:hypothetical protein